MVLIISDNKDQSTCDVIDWLKYIGTLLSSFGGQ
jgi:hypothetical protein